MNEEKETYTEEEILKELKISRQKFEEQNANDLKTKLVRVHPQTKELGMPPESSLDNEALYTGESVRKLKAKLDEEREENDESDE